MYGCFYYRIEPSSIINVQTTFLWIVRVWKSSIPMFTFQIEKQYPTWKCALVSFLCTPTYVYPPRSFVHSEYSGYMFCQSKHSNKCHIHMVKVVPSAYGRIADSSLCKHLWNVRMGSHCPMLWLKVCAFCRTPETDTLVRVDHEAKTMRSTGAFALVFLSI